MTGAEALIAASAVQAGSQLMGGISAKKAGNAEADLLEKQGFLSEYDARMAAIQKARDVTKFQAHQGHEYLASGVTLAPGTTPIVVMEETRRQGQEEVDALMRRGSAINALYKAKADQTRNAGRAAFINGIVGAVGTGIGAYAGYKKTSPTTTTTGALKGKPDAGLDYGRINLDGSFSF
jgi:hypothetical protein